jgi:hypothetical protein
MTAASTIATMMVGPDKNAAAIATMNLVDRVAKRDQLPDVGQRISSGALWNEATSSWTDGPDLSDLSWNEYVASLGPYAWWKLDEGTYAQEGSNTINDASGNGRTGTFIGDIIPTRRQAALVDGSAFSIAIPNGQANALRQTSASLLGLLTGGSHTIGFIIDTTSTAQQQSFVQGDVNYYWIGLNNTWDGAGAAAPGKISWLCSTVGLNANGLTTPDIGFNDGDPHLLMFEYDAGLDTISILMDGVVVATRSHAGLTMPTGHSTTTWGQHVAAGVDEYLFFNRVLEPAQHAELASFLT